MKILIYIFILTINLFASITACPTCIGNLHDETTPPFFSNELYQAPQSAQNNKKQLDDILDYDSNEQEKIDEAIENS
jgi:hypothetical protein